MKVEAYPFLVITVLPGTHIPLHIVNSYLSNE